MCMAPFRRTVWWQPNALHWEPSWSLNWPCCGLSKALDVTSLPGYAFSPLDDVADALKAKWKKSLQKREHERFASKGGARMPFSGASPWHCSGCAAVNGGERQRCFACGQARRAEDDEDQSVHLLHGRYRLLQVLGSGGFAVVYRAADLQQEGLSVAIKQISLSGLS